MLGNFAEMAYLMWLGALIILITIAKLYCVNKRSPSLPKDEKIAYTWFLVSGLFNIMFLGCIALDAIRMVPENDIHEFLSLWQMLASVFGNTQCYMSTLPYQAITGIMLAPLCMITTNLIVNESPLRHPLQIILCSGQLHSMILYSGLIVVDLLQSQGSNEVKDNIMKIFQLVAVCVFAIVPSILLRDNITYVTKVFNAIAKMRTTLKIYNAPRTPMKPRQRHISSTAITITQEDLQRSIANNFSPLPLPLPSPSTPTKKAKAPIAPTRSSVKKSTAPTKEASSSSSEKHESQTSMRRRVLRHLNEARNNPEPTKNEAEVESDDESLGEIDVEKTKTMEEIKQRKASLSMGKAVLARF